MIEITESIRTRYFASVKEDDAGCWVWQKSVNDKGYGQMGIGTQGTGKHKMGYAHRISWAIHCGEIPAGLNVLHKCDNPKCSNPEHLFLGTQKDNIQDMDAKGRRKVVFIRQLGEKHPLAKLKEEDVISIRRDHRPQAHIASDFGVSPSLIRKIKNNVIWRHVA